MRARDSGSRVLALPSQTPGLVEQYGVTRTRPERELWAIDGNGRLFAGAAAVNRILFELGKPWTYVAQAYRFAPLRWAENLAYRWVANHRSLLGFWSATTECERPGANCG